MSTPIVIDCDPGHDDAIAILLALASPEVELRGIVTVAGNQTVDKTTRNALKVLELAGRSDIPVVRGAAAPLKRELRTAPHVHGESGLDGPDLPEPTTRPSEADPATWLEPGVVLVPTGPLTNVALLVERGVQIERMVWMGGAIAEGNITPTAEFNAFVDPEAAAAVFAAGSDMTMIGLDVTHQALMRDEHAEELRRAGKVGKAVAELYDFFARFHAERYPEMHGSPIHDAVAVAQVVWPGIVETKPATVTVDCTDGEERGRTVVDFDGTTASVGLKIDGDHFMALLVERISSLG